MTRLFAVASIFIMTYLSCSLRENDSIKAISVTKEFWDRQKHIVVGIDSEYVTKLVENPKNELFSAQSTLTIGKKALEHMSIFISKNCKSREEVKQHSGFYVIKIFYQNEVKECCLDSTDAPKAYFSNFRKWIQQSPFNEECKEVVADLEYLSK